MRTIDSQPLAVSTRQPEPVAFHPARRIPAATVCEICGGVSDMTLHRWLKDAALAFPRPIYIGRRRYWLEADVLAWLKAREVTA
ncbi:hypothetical protein [Paracoccus sp. (in: a-proteobacteria)]|uniref:helix-turn-helix transcriptional regulator n=1 Tax=Paracoccus sp. TaxID=267 RepID=UPI002AFE06B3|nr:hypothetical protein [Paracoccus sp. (in: a-proteobacteria)]